MGGSEIDYQRQQYSYHYPIWLKVLYEVAHWLYFKADKFYTFAKKERSQWELSELKVIGKPYKFWR